MAQHVIHQTNLGSLARRWHYATPLLTAKLHRLFLPIYASGDQLVLGTGLCANHVGEIGPCCDLHMNCDVNQVASARDHCSCIV